MEPIGRILARLKLPGPGPLQQREIEQVVQAVLGEPASRDVRIASLRKERLVLEVPSAVRAFEWQAFNTEELLTELRRIPGLEQLQEVRVRVGSWRSHAEGRGKDRSSGSAP